MDWLADMIRDDGLEVLAIIGTVCGAMFTFLVSFKAMKIKMDVVIKELRGFITASEKHHDHHYSKLAEHGERLTEVETKVDGHLDSTAEKLDEILRQVK